MFLFSFFIGAHVPATTTTERTTATALSRSLFMLQQGKWQSIQTRVNILKDCAAGKR